MNEAMVTLLVALLGSSGLISGIFSIINTALSRKAARGDKQAEIKKDLEELRSSTKKEIEEIKAATQENKMDGVRTQMLLLMSDYPDDTQEILKLAELYFKELGGNFYMDSIFSKWMKKKNIDRPSWFKGK